MDDRDRRRNAAASKRACFSDAFYILQIAIALAILIGLVIRFFGG